MPQTTKLNKLLISFCLVVSLLSLKQVEAQLVIGQPNLGFTQACASDAFNTYSVTFVFSPASALNPSNQFSVELSDADGSFSNAEVIYTSSTGSVTTSPATIDFSIPQTTSGENYRIRVKSSSPVATSTPSVPFAAYYKLQDSPFTINNLVSTGAYCTGGNYLLTIDNPGTANNDSPLNYPSLTFNWFKETGPTTSVFVAEGSSLLVDEEGTYFVETNYGTCTSNSFSNRVTISEVSTSGEADVTIASSLGNPYCPEQGLTTLSTVGGNSYQWFKDGVEIANATNQMYQTNESGTFSVQVDLGDCSAFGSIDLVSELFNSAINVEDVNQILEDETLTIEITTDAVSPEFTWYLNDEVITEATENTYEASEIGNYSVIITETVGCNGSRTYDFVIERGVEPFPDVSNIPNVISPNGDFINDTWVIPLEYTTGTNTEVIILNEQGRVVFQTLDYQNNWPQDNLNLTSVNQVFYYIITPVEGNVKKGSITIVK
ncbi:hypothetical protein BWZ20_01605 [Winogradskyella sp. J14-2]|uniref:T9SS type B sorting domain-containing protein n=1 Tax=Winogradskyella sp. J14-2 TaxID=1936080 RepID=UPI000972A0B6|nr:gliding motility-associated C-terminal domain-containing protein [Winogradskyella sp. J14-2]APY07075.1 hypothetical protein BWZ20_01605 [Winogradskyella sp. J14-2]